MQKRMLGGLTKVIPDVEATLNVGVGGTAQRGGHMYID